MKKNNILVPDLPESVSDATIAKWYKKEGDIIDCDEVLLDLETDKIMLEISSPCEGKLDLILEQEGAIVKSQQI
ncbi:MAG: dihydrolipoamide succinyltransferase, partial [Buchnera aphidicola]|nr:dihydrolipoamide succinyltransferase [Buchnera aphidicola]